MGGAGTGMGPGMGSLGGGGNGYYGGGGVPAGGFSFATGSTHTPAMTGVGWGGADPGLMQGQGRPMGYIGAAGASNQGATGGWGPQPAQPMTGRFSGRSSWGGAGVVPMQQQQQQQQQQQYDGVGGYGPIYLN